MGRRETAPLSDILKDVQAFRAMLEKEGVECLRPFVGKEGTGSMTRSLFLGKLEQMVSDKAKRLFILYWAGHGGPGGLLMEGGEWVTFDDIMTVWTRRPNRQRPNPQRLIVVADSCFSGAFVDQLKAIRPFADRKTHNVGIQAACRATEVSMGSVFTSAFTLRQLEGKNFQWKQKYESNKEFKKACDDNYQNKQALGPGAHSVQHPTFFHTWEDGDFPELDMHFSFFERPGPAAVR